MSVSIEQFRLAKSLIRNEDGVFVNHSGKPEESVPARQFFMDAACPQAFIEFVLTETNQWSDFCGSDFDVYKGGVRKLDSFLSNCLDAPYGLANGSLDKIYNHGFNRHDSKHIDKVTKNVISLLKDAGEKKQTIRRAVLASRGHDLGNILSRKLHSLVSPYILSTVVEQIKPDANLPIESKKRQKQARDWRIVRRAMQLHNEPIATSLIESFSREIESESSGKRELSETEIIEKMVTHFGPEALALIIADKTDIGRHRVSEKAGGQEAVDMDPHLAVNLLGKTREIGVRKDKETFVWKLDFTPGKAKDERFAVESSVRNGMRSSVPEEWHKLHSEHSIPHFDTWKAKFWELYYDRIILTIRSVFALYPKVKNFEIEIRDVDDGETTTIPFHRDRLNYEFMKIKHAPNEKRRS